MVCLLDHHRLLGDIFPLTRILILKRYCPKYCKKQKCWILNTVFIAFPKLVPLLLCNLTFLKRVFTFASLWYVWWISLYCIFMPRHKMAVAYSVTPFRHSVIPDSVSAHYLSHTWRFSNEVWYKGLSREYAGWVWIWVRSYNNIGRVMPLGLRKIPLIFSFRSLSPLQIDILNWNSVYRCVMRKRRLSSN